MWANEDAMAEYLQKEIDCLEEEIREMIKELDEYKRENQELRYLIAKLENDNNK